MTDSATTRETVSSTKVPFTVQLTPLLFITPSNSVIDSGQTETYSLSAGGGFGPFTAELYNITGSSQQGTNITLNTLGYTSNVTVGNLETESVSLPSGYGMYICGAGSNYTFATSGQQFSWTSDISSSYNGTTSSSIGRQSSNICTASTTGAENNGMAMIGIGINEQASNLYHVYTRDPSGGTGAKGSVSTDPLTPLDYNVPSTNAFTLIVITSGFEPLSHVHLPTGCTELSFVDNSDNFESVYMAACYGQTGSQSVSVSASSSSAVSMAAYVFNSLPSGSGTISFIANTNNHKTLTYNAIATDQGSTKPFLFKSTSNTITENTALQPSTISSNGTKFDTGQSIELISTIPTTGTYPYTYNFVISNTLTGNTLFSSDNPNTYLFSANEIMIGGDTANVIVTDSASTPESVSSSNNINLEVAAAPTAALTSSNTTLDSGQGVTLEASVSNGFGPFTYTFYNVTKGTAISSCTDISTDTCSFKSSATGSFTYNVVVTDTGTTTPYIFSSNNRAITVNTDPSLIISPSSNLIDSGGSETYTLTVDGGTSPYTLELTDVNLNSHVGSNVIINSPGGSNTITFTIPPSSAGTLTFNATGTDLGTTTPFVFNSTRSHIEVSTDPSISIVPTNVILISGQYEKFNVFETNGIGPFNIELYNITGSKPMGTNITISKNTNGNFMPFKTDATGIFQFNAIATDKGANPHYLFTSDSNSITVLPLPSVSITPNSPKIDKGQSISLSTSVTGGSNDFTYQWYTGTPGGSNTLINGATTSSYTASPSTTTSYFIVVTDIGVTTPYIFNSVADSVTVNPALAATPLTTPVTLDSGQSFTFSTTASGGTSPYTYSWTTNGLTVASGCTATSNICKVTAPTVSASTSYTVSVTVGDSSTGSPQQTVVESSSVTVNPALKITLSPSSVNLDAGQTELFTNTTTGGTPTYSYTYIISPNSGFSISGNKITFNTAGTYSVSIEAKDSATTPATTTSAPSTVTVAPDLSASPNPPTVTNATIDLGQISIANTLISGGTNLLGGQYNTKFANLTSGCIPTGCGATFPLVSFDSGNNLIMVIKPLSKTSIEFTAIASGSSQSYVYSTSNVPGIAPGKSIYGPGRVLWLLV